MTSKLTRDRLEEIRDYDTCVTLEESAELARMALAAVDGEPVAYADPQSFDNFKSNGGENAACTKEWMWRDPSDGLIPLYSHAQQPVVPDRSIFEKWWESQNGAPLDGWDSLRTNDGYCDDGIDGQFEAWNAGMLNHPSSIQPNTDATPGAEIKHPSSNSPVIPEGYVMVPKEPTEAMMLHNSGCQHHARDDPDCAMRQTRRLIWSHMLTAAQQEVK